MSVDINVNWARAAIVLSKKERRQATVPNESHRDSKGSKQRSWKETTKVLAAREQTGAEDGTKLEPKSGPLLPFMHNF
uniref:GK19400 n=1 Tax=Drosophila willistoni TaxID=7260 RepID=B4MPR0_DROWI